MKSLKFKSIQPRWLSRLESSHTHETKVMFLTPESLAYASNDMWGDWAGSWLAVKRSAGVASKVIPHV